MEIGIEPTCFALNVICLTLVNSMLSKTRICILYAIWISNELLLSSEESRKKAIRLSYRLQRLVDKEHSF